MVLLDKGARQRKCHGGTAGWAVGGGCPPSAPQSTPRLFPEYSQSTSRVLPEYSQSTPRVPPEHSQSTPRALLEYSHSTPRVLPGHSQGTPSVLPLSTPQCTHSVRPISTPRLLPDYSLDYSLDYYHRLPLDYSLAFPRLPTQGMGGGWGGEWCGGV